MTNDARAACALSAHNCKVVSARLDNDTPTLRITGCTKKMEHISVPVSVTRICASVALLTVTKRAPHRGAARTFSCNLRGERWHERARSSNACARSIANVVCASRAAPADACASTRRSYQHARHAANGARATRALAAHNHSGVSARMDNDSPTLRIIGPHQKLEHISVPISVTIVAPAR